MSEDFTFTLVGDKKAVPLETVQKIIQELALLEFNYPESILRVSYDEATNTVDETEEEEYLKVDLAPDGTVTIEPKNWQGCALELHGKLFNLYIIVSSFGNFNVHIDVPKRKLMRVLQNNEEQLLYHVICTVAKICQVSIGFAEMEQPFTIFSKKDAFEAIWHRPADRKFPSSIGLLKIKNYPEEKIHKNMEELFLIHTSNLGYLILIEKDFYDIYFPQ